MASRPRIDGVASTNSREKWRFGARHSECNSCFRMLVVAFLLGLVTPVSRAQPAECGTSYREIRLTDLRRVDSIRIYLHGGQGSASASRVTVKAGGSGRALTVTRGGVWGLKFEPPLEARSLTVTVEPAGLHGACIDRIVLSGGTDEVAVVTP